MERKNLIIVITGASSGIGFSIAKELASDGNKIYAGARKQTDLDKLSKITNITPIELDITHSEQIEAAVHRITQEEGHIDVLINNAGVIGWGAVMDRDMDYFRTVMDINFFGHVQMIKQFYPLLRKSVNHPIIINISSQAGNYAMPFWSAYHSSKWALEAFSHSLRRELKPYGIRLCIIQPGAIQSQAFTNDKKDFALYKARTDSDFVKYAAPMLDAAFNHPPVSKEKSPLKVVNVIRRAIYNKKNAIYYQPGRRLIPDFIIAKLPYRTVDKIFDKLLRK
ncbi:MAG: SDR family oxidoreductase [Lachnospiraceae bacterium]|nr:SDR family oxidoreductase [Lachnospiraceae bacterium]